jgi:hypothetical protein
LALAAALVVAAAAPTGAGAVVLHDQLAPTGNLNVNSQNFETSLNAYDDLGADDFVVPAGRIWRIDQVEVSADGSGLTPAATANLFVFADGGALPGAQLFERLNLPRQPGPTYPDLSLNVPDAPTLSAGRYWVGVQANLTFSPGSNNWWWSDHAPQVGRPAAWRQPGDGFGGGCTAFVVRQDCPSYQPSSEAPDQAFRLSGAEAGEALGLLKAKPKRKGRLRARVNVPATGTLRIRSKALKKAAVEIEEIGTTVLRLKPKRAARRSLAEEGAFKTKLKLILTTDDGATIRAKARAKLKP